MIPKENGTPAATATGRKPKANKKARVAPRRAHVAPPKAKSARKEKSAKKAPLGRTNPEVAKPKVDRHGSKIAKILDLLKRPGGTTSKELMKATGWLPHSVRGFLSGTVGNDSADASSSLQNPINGRMAAMTSNAIFHQL